MVDAPQGGLSGELFGLRPNNSPLDGSTRPVRGQMTDVYIATFLPGSTDGGKSPISQMTLNFKTIDTKPVA